MKSRKLSFISLLFLFACFSNDNKAIAQWVTQKTVYAEIGTHAELDYKQSYLSFVNAGTSIFERRWFVFAAEANVFKFWNPDYSSVGLGVRPVLKLYPIRRPQFGLFWETKGGLMYMLPEYSNAAINYTLLSSIGGEINIGRGNALYAAGGYTHYSNGKRRGDAKNPTWDGFGGHVGISHTLK